MGLCFSKKQQAKRRDGEPSSDTKKSGGRKSGMDTVFVADAKKAPQAKAPAPPKKAVARPEEPTADKRTVFVVKAAAAAAAAEVAAASKGGREEAEAKRAAPEEEPRPVAVGRAPVRTSSCTKEEVDAILIQCGRLSRSSSASGKAPSGEHRRYAGSKRSYDFDHERRGGGGDVDECDWGREGAVVARPSPRRRTPERKRSSSHDGRTGGGSGSRSRRISRSPGRRADVVPAAGSSGTGERGARQQPGKMVSVPAREKGRPPSPVKAASSGKRYPSPRSNSPARAAASGNENAGAQSTQGPSLSRSSSRKAEQSPFRRNPMVDLDENALGNNHHHNGKPLKKSADGAVAIALPQKTAERAKDQIPCCQTAKEKEIVEEAVASDTKSAPARMNATHSVSIVAENVTNPRPGSRSSRRSSRDFEHNGNTYASLLLEDIQNYHQQSTSAATATEAPTFALPACVSKACSILEAVADLNSSSSENKSFELERSVNDKESVNGGYGGKGAGTTLVVESEVGVKDDLMEPSMHKYVSVRDIRGETEPQESAGSNSFAGNAWTCSWEPNSVDSTDRTRTASQSYNGDEVEQSWQSKQKPSSSQEPSHRGSSSNVQVQRVRGAHRLSGSSSAIIGQSDVRGASATSSIA
ncbi:unnamed protein product [Miscanthus lutarioriparius]|uniref:Uncharacterized protein n=1 Tax=Miscanthus lutarioriparius TaxID=422564 RepID=A0A811QTK2_9POAL|nr:unnamed protein product [Miscanthus lutarioriparius]